MESKQFIENVIHCLGVDGNRHHCHAWEDKALCGIKIESKKDGLTQHREGRILYSCYECDAQLDKLFAESEKEM